MSHLPDDPPGMNQPWDPCQDGQTDVDEEVSATSALEEDGQLQHTLASQVTHAKAMSGAMLTGGMKMAMK
jgi:hypothetical protein